MFVISQTSSKGRHVYGMQSKLVVSPEMVGKAVSSEWWDWNNDYTKTAGNTIIYPTEEFL